MNTGSTISTAMLRGVWAAALGFAGTFLTTYAVTDELKASLIGAGTAACIALGWRGGAEGFSDASRDAKHQVLPGDVGQQNA